MQDKSFIQLLVHSFDFSFTTKNLIKNKCVLEHFSLNLNGNYLNNKPSVLDA